MIKFTPALIIIFSTYCSTLPLHHQSDKGDRFRHYITTLNHIPLPLRSSTLHLKFNNVSPGYDRKEFELFHDRNTTRPLGILFKNTKYTVIADISIGDQGPVPFFTCYDDKGNVTDSLAPYPLSGDDEESITFENLLVTAKQKIVVTDTTNTWKLDAKGKAIPHSTKITAGITYYSLSPRGKFLSRHISSLL
ncbi:hypothetical protein KXQ82_15540 [Mucilaginibacter sp. HMF5004]|uniref:hypothetical protein n=1 Tax=Mucilaginibacter rivuli TaxID=2857527 RepID=UPI001C5E7D64|nr:hypothetical protein [Mucilaginibacter rivuli]MBW4891138.1 hypothetical protein [Mucilaginibacter rivuli]